MIAAATLSKSGNLLGRAPDPAALTLLQCEVLGDHVGDSNPPAPAPSGRFSSRT